MTRTWAIAKRTFTELLRDKRTLALMFLAPVVILALLNYAFSINSTTSVKVGTVNVEQSVRANLDSVKHVSTAPYDNRSQATSALKNQKIDAVLVEKDDQDYDVLYANTDASKTAMTRAALSNAFTKDKMGKLVSTLTELSAKLGLHSPAASGKFNLNESYNYGNKDTNFFASIMPIFMGFFVFLFVFLISGISLLKERTSGTLSRLLATPVKRSEIVYGYMISYGLLAIIQTAIIVFFTIYVLNVEVVGSIFNLFFINVLLALVALAFGLFISTLAKSEFQMMQFIPIVVVPQILFSGIIPLDSMASWARIFGDILPLKYTADAMSGVVLHGEGFNAVAPDLLALLIFLLVLVAANIIGLRRYRKV